MPRKLKLEKQTATVIVNGVPVTVVLHPPAGMRKTWYVYWNGLVASKSTGQRKLEDALVVVENMVKNGGKRTTFEHACLSDEEFKTIQRTHFGRRHDQPGMARSAKSLYDCMEAIDAFREIIKMPPIIFHQPIAAATPDICAAFQRQALTLPRNWRMNYPNKKAEDEVSRIRANTVVKWSRVLQAAFQRANRNAGRKCVRGVVSADKLLTENPWMQFTWIAGEDRPIRQFDHNELLSLLDYFERKWAGISVAVLLAKMCLWSQCRRMEITSLTWPQLKNVGTEYHFEVVGKWGVEKWFRIPESLYRELLAIKTDSPYVFAAYVPQLRQFYERSHNPWRINMVGAEFNPVNLGDWFHERLVDWSENMPSGRATAHVFRKTSLQYALSGESASSRVAADARVSEAVLLRHYAKVTDPERRVQSNRTFARIVASLDPEVAARYGQIPINTDELERRLRVATTEKDWVLAAQLTAELAALRPGKTG